MSSTATTVEPPAALDAPAARAQPSLRLIALAKPAVPGTWMRIAGQVMTVAGIVFVLFLGYSLFVSDLTQARSQRLMLHQLDAELAASGAAANPTSTGGVTGLAPGATRGSTFGPGPTPRGRPMALLRIPSLSVQQVVVEGTGADEMRQGPGHYRGTAFPGEPGNAAIAGHRTSYGAPFADLGALERGDRIRVTDRAGTSTYVVTSEARRIAVGAADPLRPTTDNRLTLVTSAPKYLASEWYVVTARLKGRAVAPPPGSVRGVPNADETGFGGRPGAWFQVIVLAQLFAVALLATRALYRRWLRWPTWLLSTPVLLALLFLLFESLGAVLPSTI